MNGLPLNGPRKNNYHKYFFANHPAENLGFLYVCRALYAFFLLGSKVFLDLYNFKGVLSLN